MVKPKQINMDQKAINIKPIKNAKTPKVNL
jgi:hypothetical protein